MNLLSFIEKIPDEKGCGESLRNYLNEMVRKMNRRYFAESLFDRLLITAISDVWYPILLLRSCRATCSHLLSSLPGVARYFVMPPLSGIAPAPAKNRKLLKPAVRRVFS